MKYFLARGHIRPDIRQIISEKDFEIPKDLAFRIYKSHAGPGKLNLKAIPNYNKGTEIIIRRGTVRVWGENISDSECFRRRLEGTLHVDIVDTDANEEIT